MEAKAILGNILKAVKNHNKIYSLMAFWSLWLIYVVGGFEGSNMALVAFFGGFCITAVLGAYITDNPNEKERKLIEKWFDWLERN